MKVELLEYTDEADILSGLSAKSCRSSKAPSDIYQEKDNNELKEVLRKVIEMGHTSVIEHASFTFSIEEISRSCSHQLVRHRIASYSQQSQREVKLDDPSYVTPPNITEQNRAVYDSAMDDIWKVYRFLINNDISEEDARFVLPNATKTNIIMTMNARSLLNFFELRTCLHAQWEIRAVANKMLSEVKKVAPVIFENAGPLCKTKNKCYENDKECSFYKKYIE